MQIEQMNATFGRLNGSQLDLQPGLNVICAPNESGKSTWCRFLQNMLYGVPTKERGLLADKNRYAPWSGSPMQGRLLLRNGDARYTLLRETRRATAPMGDAHLTYTGTADPVPGIPAAEAGQYLLGIPREVFLRSAFIGQNALAVDQDAELERRIAALISTGEEDTSYSESYERLIPIEGTPVDMLNPPEGCPFAPRCEHAMKICLQKMPPYVELGEGHRSACWLRVQDQLDKAGQEKPVQDQEVSGRE